MSEQFVFGIGGNADYSWSLVDEAVRVIVYQHDADDGPQGHPVEQFLLDEATLMVMLAGVQFDRWQNEQKGGTAE